MHCQEVCVNLLLAIALFLHRKHTFYMHLSPHQLDIAWGPLNDVPQCVAQLFWNVMRLHPAPCLPPCSFKTRGCFCGRRCLFMCSQSSHIVLKTLSACVCLGPWGDVCRGCRPWVQLCLSEKYLAVTDGKPEPQEGQQGPRDPANRKLIQTVVHLPNIHSLEISVSLMFFMEMSLFI